MKIVLDGWHKYQLHDLTAKDLQSLYNAIDAALLPERRIFNDLKTQIKELLCKKK